jgi:hypothetical protein
MIALARATRGVSRRWHSALSFIVGLVLGGFVFGSVNTANSSVEATTQAIQDPCHGGNEVSRFVCRNTWVGQHSLSYR